MSKPTGQQDPNQTSQHDPADGANAGDQSPAPEPESQQDAQHEADVAEADPATLAEQLAEAQQQASDNWDKYLRASADLNNVRQRAEREVVNAHRYALEKPAQDLLAAVDSLELGLKSAEEPNSGKDAVAEGMRLTLKQLTDALEKHGITPIDPAGEAFDPERHEAVSMVESDQVKPQHVLSVMQKGYVLHERLIRPAMVVVAKAPSE